MILRKNDLLLFNSQSSAIVPTSPFLGMELSGFCPPNRSFSADKPAQNHMTPSTICSKASLLFAVFFSAGAPALLAQGLATGASAINEAAITRIIRVNGTTGNDTTGDGTTSKPYQSVKAGLTRALSLKNAGTPVKVSIAPGIYREGTVGSNYAMGGFVFSNTSSAPMVIEGEGWNSANPGNTGDVVITGSEDFSANSPTRPGNWTKNVDGTWTKAWPYSLGMAGNPISPSGVSDAFLRYEAAFVDGVTYYQVNPPNYTNQNGTVGGVSDGDIHQGGRLEDHEGSFWVVDAVLDDSGNVVTPGSVTIRPPVNAPADYDINAKVVEINTKRTLFQFFRYNLPQNAAKTNLVIRNLTFRRSGGSYGLLIQEQDNMLVEDCRFTQFKQSGGTFQPVKNTTFRRCEFSFNGNTGVNPHSLTNVRFEHCKFNNNSRQGEIVGFTGYSVCGIKIMRSERVTMYRCEARNNRSTGFWWDVKNVDCEMIECVSEYNSTNGTFLEASSSEGNNYSELGTGTVGTEPVLNLGSRPTVQAIRSIFAHNRPAPGTETYRTSKGRGVWISESENCYLENCIVYNNDVQIGTYDNTRGENRNNQFRGNIIAAQNTNQRLYAVGSDWDSGETITVRNSATPPVVVAVIKGGWYALWDGMNGTTNDNTYYFRNPAALPARSQRYGANISRTTRPWEQPTLTLAQWRSAHLANTNDVNTADEAVDSRSRLITDTNTATTDFDGAYDGRPLVAPVTEVASIRESAGSTHVFTLHRVSPGGYDSALTVNYTLRANAGDATNGTDVASLSGTATIPAGQRSVTVAIDPSGDTLVEGPETLALVVSDSANYVTAGSATATATLEDDNASLGNLTAVLTSATQIDLAWQNGFGLTGAVVIERAEGTGAFAEIARLPAGTLSYRDETNARSLSYRVRATDQTADTYSNVAVVSARDAYANISAVSANQLTGANFTTSGVLGGIYDGYVARYDNVHIPRGATAFTAFLSQGQQSVTRSIEVRLGSATATPIATLSVAYTGGWGAYQNQSATIASTISAGLHTVFLTFKGGSGVCNLNRFSFTAASTATVPGTPANLTATPATGGISLAWSASSGATQYHLDRQHSSDGFVRVATLSSASTGYADSGLTSGQTYTYRLRAAAPAGVSSFATVSGSPATALQSWRIQRFGTPSATGNAANSADPDGNGVSNLLEYALDIPAGDLSASSKLPAVTYDESSGRLKITFLRARADLTYTVVASPDLLDWTSVVATNPGQVSSTTPVTVTDSAPPGSRRFLRLNVSEP